MLEWIKDLYRDITDPGPNGAWRGYGPFWRGYWAASARISVWGLPLLLVVVLFSGCVPGAAGATITKIGHLLRAATALQQLAESAADQEGTPEAGEILEQQLPVALEQLDVALGELCAAGGPLRSDDKVCRHYRAYKADLTE